VSGIGDALKAIKKAILLEERISSQSRKVEQLAESVLRRSKAAWRVFSLRLRHLAAGRGVHQN
jgi:hypothetical protein